jgi:hypothetical protein
MEKVGVKSITCSNLLFSLNAKRDLLLFDKLMINKDNYESAIRVVNSIQHFTPMNSNCKRNIDEIEFLMNKGLMTFAETDFALTKNLDETIRELLVNEIVGYSEMCRLHLTKIEGNSNLINLIEWEDMFGNLSVRFNSIFNRLVYNIDSFPIISKSSPTNNAYKKADVYSILLKELPVPDETITWDRLIEIKTDKDLRRKYHALINWVNTVSYSPLTINEINDQYDYLYHEYEYQIELHKLKFKNSSLEIVVNSTAEILENIVKFNFSKVTKALFSFNKERIEMLESETKIQGKELAYIFDIKNIIY